MIRRVGRILARGLVALVGACKPVDVAELRRRTRCDGCGGYPLATGRCPVAAPSCIWTWTEPVPMGQRAVTPDPWDEDEDEPVEDEDTPLLSDVRARECEEAGCEGCAWCGRGVEYQEEE